MSSYLLRCSVSGGLEDFAEQEVRRLIMMIRDDDEDDDDDDDGEEEHHHHHHHHHHQPMTTVTTTLDWYHRGHSGSLLDIHCHDGNSKMGDGSGPKIIIEEEDRTTGSSSRDSSSPEQPIEPKNNNNNNKGHGQPPILLHKTLLMAMVSNLRFIEYVTLRVLFQEVPVDTATTESNNSDENDSSLSSLLLEWIEERCFDLPHDDDNNNRALLDRAMDAWACWQPILDSVLPVHTLDGTLLSFPTTTSSETNLINMDRGDCSSGQYYDHQSSSSWTGSSTNTTTTTTATTTTTTAFQ